MILPYFVSPSCPSSSSLQLCGECLAGKIVGGEGQPVPCPFMAEHYPSAVVVDLFHDMCPQHPGMVMLGYCPQDECEQLTCLKCSMFQYHGHTVPLPLEQGQLLLRGNLMQS